MRQRWEDLLFAHWAVASKELGPLIPDGLELDTWAGSAWLGVVPFRLSGLRLRRGPPLPRVHSFFELNVRTYVRDAERPAVWFFSLDASSRAAVVGARRTYRLPYHLARMSAAERGGWIEFSSERVGGGLALSGRYRPEGGPVPAAPESLEHFLVERYRLYAADRRARIYHADVLHDPWPLCTAAAELDVRGLPVEVAGEPHLRFSRSVDVRIWPPRLSSLPS